MVSRITILAALASVALASTGAIAAPAKTPTAQQMKMSQCNKDAVGKTGNERKDFMKSCLSAHPRTAAKPTQQEKMKSCNADATAKSMKGDSRKTYMKTCLSHGATPATH